MGRSGWLDSGVMGVLGNGFSPTGAGRGCLQPQIFGLPRHIRPFPFTAGVWAEIGESCTYNSSRQDLCVCVSVTPNTNSVMISLLEQVEKGKCLPVPGVSVTLRDDSAEAGRGHWLCLTICDLPTVTSELNLEAEVILSSNTFLLHSVSILAHFNLVSNLPL